MTKSDNRLFVSLFGAFAVTGPIGEDLTPKSARARGMLALLATSSEFSLSRTQLSEMLWSDRGASQRAASFRQALSEVRRAFGDQADVMTSNRKTISLDPKRVSVTQPGAGERAEEFLADLSITDPKFTEWRTSLREGKEKSSSRNMERPALIFEAVNKRPDLMRLFEDQFIELAGRSAQESHSIDVYLEYSPQIGRSSHIVTVQAYHLVDEGMIGLRVSLEAVDTRRLIWSGHSSEPFRTGPVSQSIDNMRLNQQLQTRLADVFAQPRTNDPHDADANLLAAIGIRRMFSMRHDNLRIADELFGKAFDLEARGLFEAWRAQLCTIRFIEQEGADKDELRERAARHCARALELEPLNPNVLSCVANARLALEGDVEGSLQLSRLGTEMNPGNALAWWAHSNAQLYADDYTAAADSADRAYRLSSATHFQFWCAFQASVSKALIGDLSDAIKKGREAQVLAPHFRPALRYLVALHCKREDFGAAQRALDELRRLEPDASVDRMLNDRDYPSSLLRNTILGDKLQDLQ